MPLESLSNEQINIHDLTIEEEKNPMPEWQKHYEELKKTQLYDSEKEQWKYDMRLGNTSRWTNAQLTGVLIEFQLNKSSALELYETLKETEFYDKEKQQWNWYLHGDQTLGSSERGASAQLLDVLVESQFDKPSAIERYETLKETELYDKEKKQWKYKMNKNQILIDHNLYADAQLLDILIEDQINKSSAQVLYKKLKKTQLYDKKIKQWNWYLGIKSRCACSQLLGVLVESKFDKSSAQELYLELKKTELYDEKKQQWNMNISQDQNLMNRDRISFDQLLGILCEKEFEEDEVNLNYTTPPLPESRQY